MKSAATWLQKVELWMYAGDGKSTTNVMTVVRDFETTADCSRPLWFCTLLIVIILSPIVQLYKPTDLKQNANKFNQRAKSVVVQPRTTKLSRLNKRTHLHSGAKPHECTCVYGNEICAVAVSPHTHLHTGEKPHECTVCERDLQQ